MSRRRVLLVDDEQRLREMIKGYVAHEGFEVVEAGDGAEAISLFEQQQFQLVILDVMLPKVDGWTVCREIRRTSQVPVIMLTARGEEYDRLFGFELGVDDYLVKPFSPKELLARMRAIIRRSEPAGQQSARVAVANLEVDLDAHTACLAGQELLLAPKEFDLLAFFVQHPNQVFSREQLLSAVWGYDFTGDSRTVDTHVKVIRERLGERRGWLATVWGVGYKFQPQVRP